MQKLRKNGWMTLLLGTAVGCGQAEAIDLARQEGNLRKHYEQAKQSTAKLTAKEKRIRQERLRMQFGDMAVPE